jgi:hypothetical protein
MTRFSAIGFELYSQPSKWYNKTLAWDVTTKRTANFVQSPELPDGDRAQSQNDLVANGIQLNTHEHPLVPPHVSHFRQVPLRTMVKLPHSLHDSPS